MAVSYTKPLSSGFNRMKDVLFRPFDLVQWLVIGFGAWLASLAGTTEEAASSSTEFDSGDFENVSARLPELIHDKFDMFMAGTAFTVIVLAILAALLILYVVIQFVSSRGEFIFLENVVAKRGAITAPWKEYAGEANSLFWWRLFFEIVFFILVIFTIFMAVLVFLPGLVVEEWMPASVATLVIGLWFLLILSVIAAYMKLFLKDFVVPLMFKRRVGIMDGWRMFLDLFRLRPWEFLLYGLFVMVLYLGAYVAAAIFALITCCVGLMLISIPYVGTVLLLPLYVTYRSFSVYFLQQLGAGFDLFQDEPVEAEPEPEGA